MPELSLPIHTLPMHLQPARTCNSKQARPEAAVEEGPGPAPSPLLLRPAPAAALLLLAAAAAAPGRCTDLMVAGHQNSVPAPLGPPDALGALLSGPEGTVGEAADGLEVEGEGEEDLDQEAAASREACSTEFSATTPMFCSPASCACQRMQPPPVASHTCSTRTDWPSKGRALGKRILQALMCGH